MDALERHIAAMSRVAELIDSAAWYRAHNMPQCAESALEDAARVMRAVSGE